MHCNKKNNKGYLSEKQKDDFIDAFNSDQENNSSEDVLNKNESTNNIFGELKDDRAIVKNAA